MSIDQVFSRAAHNAWEFAFGEFVWYALLAGSVWLAFYVLFRERAKRRKINPRWPTWSQLGWEIRNSILSLGIFGLTAALIAFLRWGGLRTQLYKQIDLYGWTWYGFSFVLAVVLHDAYFYWTHRLMHLRWLFRRMHRIHHLSNNPTPWAAYSFSASEAAVQAAIGPLILYTVPMHYSTFLLFMIWQIGFNVFGHCGYEIYPHWFLRTWAGRFLNTPTHHAMHHEKIHGNYGLYFNYWDRLMGTNHPDYEHRFLAATELPQRSAEFSG